MKSAIAIRHVPFEGLGSLQTVLVESGFDCRYIDIGKDDFSTLPDLQPDLLIVLGAPVGVYEEDLYPFLISERELLTRRLRANQPTLGICLGAQQMARALGANVSFSGHKEIGFAPIDLTTEGQASPLHHLEGNPVLHWHGDTFDIPANATHLASTAICKNQAFSIGTNILALQFHSEIADVREIEAWLVGHASELASAKIDPRSIRHDAELHVGSLRKAAEQMFRQWIAELR
jgi:GMP synthase (glutamine-hydrolysing)